MIVTDTENLEELVNAEMVGAYGMIGLTVESIHEFRTSLRIKGRSFNRDVYQEVEKYQDYWQLKSNKPYVAEFNETVDLPKGFVPIIFPSSMPTEVGLHVYPRIATNNEIYTTIRPSLALDVHQDSLLGLMFIANPFNRSLPLDEGEETDNDEAQERDAGDDSN